MTEDQFWEIIAASGPAGADRDEWNAAIAERLGQLGENERVDFGRIYDLLDRNAYRWELWGAAYQINGGCSDDGFDYFRAWLISQGRSVYEAALAGPDSLADHCDPDVDEYENEDFLHGAREALDGVEMPPFPIEPAGEAWDFDDEEEMMRRYPRLCGADAAASDDGTNGELEEFSDPGGAASIELGTFDNEAVEARIRELTLAFMQSEEFSTMFGEIHPGKIEQWVVKGIGLFNKNIREIGRNLAARRQLGSPELRQRYVAMAGTAPIVFAHVVMANTAALEEGIASPALVVLAWGDGAMDVMATAREVLGRVHFGSPEGEQEHELARLVEDEEYHFGRRRPLPGWLVGDEEAYAADLWVSSKALDNERLASEVIVCFAERGPNGLTMAIPGALVQQAIRELDPNRPKPPPFPPSKPNPGPPPFPPRG